MSSKSLRPLEGTVLTRSQWGMPSAEIASRLRRSPAFVAHEGTIESAEECSGECIFIEV